MNAWTERTSSGRYRARVRLDDGRKVTVDTFDTEEEAKAVAATSLVLLQEKAPTGLTVAAWVDRYIYERDVAKEIRSIETQRSSYECHIKKDPIGRVTVKALRRGHVVDWVRRLSAKMSRGSALRCLVVMNGALKAGVDRGLCKENVANGVKPPKALRTEDPWTFLIPDEQEKLVGAYASPDQWIVAFAIGTGLRAGELAALRRADVRPDAESPVVVVRYGSPPMHPTKTGKVREVPLFGVALQAWRAWLEASVAYKNPLGLAFPRRYGAYRDPAHVLPWATWKKMKAAAGLTRNVRWHDLRHTCASSLISGWWGRAWRLEEVQAMLGHSSITVTQRYAHLAGTALQKAAEETVLFAPFLPQAPVGGKLISSIVSREPQMGLEPATYALRKSGVSQRDDSGIGRFGVAVGRMALSVLKAAHSGDPSVSRLAVELAIAVLEEIEKQDASAATG